jgi:hypothetical protein
MAYNDPIYYLATLDSGNASLRWPQRDPAAANQAQQGLYDEEITGILKLDLLWRPGVSVRHIDLFDNLAFAKFLRDHHQEVMTLADAGLITVCAPTEGAFREVFEWWVVAGGPERPMHWHHLSNERQHDFDRANGQGKIASLESVSLFLHLEEHRLLLDEMVKRYDVLFPQSGILRLSPTVPASWYAKRVEEKWVAFLKDRDECGLRPTKSLRQIGETLARCWEEKQRRSGFYTAIESLATQSHPTRRDRLNLAQAVAATKTFVLNDAFYDEFERFGTDRGIVANRDISNVWLEEDEIPPASPVAGGVDPLLSVGFIALDEISLSDVVACHTAVHDEAKAFQGSLCKLQSLRIRARRGHVARAEVATAAKDHVEILRACLLRILRDRGRAQVIEGCVAEVFLGTDPGIAGPVASSGAAASAYLAAYLHSLGPLIGLIASPLFAFLVRRKALKYKWQQFEVSLTDHIVDKISPM